MAVLDAAEEPEQARPKPLLARPLMHLPMMWKPVPSAVFLPVPLPHFAKLVQAAAVVKQR